jgi:hypothetical protein
MFSFITKGRRRAFLGALLASVCLTLTGANYDPCCYYIQGTQLVAGGAATSYVATLPANTGTLSELNLAELIAAAKTYPQGDLLLKGTSTGTVNLQTNYSSTSSPVVTLPGLAGTISGTYGAIAANIEPTNPTARSATGGIMAGLGADTGGSGAHKCQIVSNYGGRLRLTIGGVMFNTASSDTVALVLYYDDVATIAAPANNASTTGIALTNFYQGSMTAASAPQMPFFTEGLVSSSTAGHTYWFDLQVSGNAGTQTIENITCNAFEF